MNTKSVEEREGKEYSISRPKEKLKARGESLGAR